MTQEEADKFQNWAELEGEIAWHLIERHADTWAEISLMMDSWLRARYKRLYGDSER